MDPARSTALFHAIGLSGSPPDAGGELPPFFHRAYFWTIVPDAKLGADGHPALGEFIPDLGFPIRMWAGGALSFVNALTSGRPATQTSTIEAVENKSGSTGPFALVSIRHDITQGGRLCTTERQDLVFRESAGRGGKLQNAPGDEDQMWSMSFDRRSVMRYSAVTFNAHRIHYDQEFCRTELDLPDVVVHGPLLAQHLMIFATEKLGQLRHFSYRATAPLCVSESVAACWRNDGSMWIRGQDGRQIMQANAS